MISVASSNENSRDRYSNTPTCILPLHAWILCGCLSIHNLLNIDVLVPLDLYVVIWWCCYHHQWCSRSVYPCTICGISWTLIIAFSCGHSQLVGEESCYRYLVYCSCQSQQCATYLVSNKVLKECYTRDYSWLVECLVFHKWVCNLSKTHLAHVSEVLAKWDRPIDLDKLGHSNEILCHLSGAHPLCL